MPCDGRIKSQRQGQLGEAQVRRHLVHHRQHAGHRSGHESIAIQYRTEIDGIQSVYLMDPLKILEGDEIYVELTDSLSPGVIKSNRRSSTSHACAHELERRVLMNSNDAGQRAVPFLKRNAF